MIKARNYLDFCIMCRIPLSHTEQRVLEDLTDKYGWVDEKEYVDAMAKTPIFLTKNQLRLLALLPKRYEHVGRRRLESIGYFLAETYQLNTYSF